MVILTIQFTLKSNFEFCSIIWQIICLVILHIFILRVKKGFLMSFIQISFIYLLYNSFPL